MTRWPSPLPGPAWHAWRTAWDHIETKTLAGVPHDTVQAIRAFQTVRTAEDRTTVLAQSGDVLATQQAAQKWNTAIRQALKAHQEACV